MRSRSRRWVFALVSLAVGVVLALLAAELMLRLLGVESPQFYAYDAERGVRHRAGATGLYKGDGQSWVQINSAGLRSPEIGRAKPAGTLRIAVLGDSFAEALGVAQEQTFWSVMAQRLAACPAVGGRRVEAVNFGVSGYGTSSEWITLQREGWAFDPDIVLLAFFTGNDLRNNVPELEDNPFRLYHRLQAGQLVEYKPAPAWLASLHGAATRLWRGLAQVSRVAQVLNQARRMWREWRLRVNGFDASPAAAAGVEAGIDNTVLMPPQEPTWQYAWEVTEAVLGALADDVKAHGRQLHVTTVSNAIQVHPDSRVRSAFMQRLGVTELGYAERRVAEVAARHGVPLVALAPPLLAWSELNQRCVHGFGNAAPCFGHWNEDGHRVAGEVLAQALCAQLPAAAR